MQMRPPIVGVGKDEARSILNAHSSTQTVVEYFSNASAVGEFAKIESFKSLEDAVRWIADREDDLASYQVRSRGLPFTQIQIDAIRISLGASIGG